MSWGVVTMPPPATGDALRQSELEVAGYRAALSPPVVEGAPAVSDRSWVSAWVNIGPPPHHRLIGSRPGKPIDIGHDPRVPGTASSGAFHRLTRGLPLRGQHERLAGTVNVGVQEPEAGRALATTRARGTATRRRATHLSRGRPQRLVLLCSSVEISLTACERMSALARRSSALLMTVFFFGFRAKIPARPSAIAIAPEENPRRIRAAADPPRG